MEFRQLGHFVAVAEEGQFTRAASRDPTMTRALAASCAARPATPAARAFIALLPESADDP